MPFGLGIWEILILAGVLVLLFGAKGAPGMARRLGTGVREMKDAVTDMDPRSLLDPKDEPAKARAPALAAVELEAAKPVAPVAAPAAERRRLERDRPRADGRRRYETLEPFTTKDGSTIREYIHSPAQSLAEATLEPGQSTMRHYHASARRSTSSRRRRHDGARRRDARGGGGRCDPDPARRLARAARRPGGVRLLCCCVPPYSHDDTYFA